MKLLTGLLPTTHVQLNLAAPGMFPPIPNGPIVDASGNWTNWNGPWNSGLKLHAAGYRVNIDGTLGSRGQVGNFRSGVQNSSTYGPLLRFNSGDSDIYFHLKAYGYSLRCIK